MPARRRSAFSHRSRLRRAMGLSELRRRIPGPLAVARVPGGDRTPDLLHVEQALYRSELPERGVGLPPRNRTSNRRVRTALLCPLSQREACVSSGGFEPPISSLSAKCLHRLGYDDLAESASQIGPRGSPCRPATRMPHRWRALRARPVPGSNRRPSARQADALPLS